MCWSKLPGGAVAVVAWTVACCVSSAGAGCASDEPGEVTSRAAASANAGAGARSRQDADARGGSDGLIVRRDPDDAGAEPSDARSPRDADTTGCGDGLLQANESCDDGNDSSGDGCSADCMQVERDYVCPAPGEDCVSTVVCGDSHVSGGERCDDGNLTDGDGCNQECHLEQGYVCPKAGELCVAADCGDRVIAADEQCEDDDDTPADGDGCSAQCRVELGWVCGDPGKPCREAVCNDGVKEGGEACDDGNQDVGDGCTPFCEAEPDCGAGACRSRCGDGLLLPGGDEECDDGNLADHDGCSSTCEVEPGFACALERLERAELPDTLRVPVTYRDFNALPVAGATGHPDFEAFGGEAVTPNMVSALLGADGKPVYNDRCDTAAGPYPEANPETGPCPYNQQLTTKHNFDQWYRDVPGVSIKKVEQLRLMRDPADGAYKVTNDAFFPWDGDANSWVGRMREQTYDGHNFGFTTEVRTYFEYIEDPQSPATLTFTGDDDVWVFINRHLAVDIGGLHFELERSVTLDPATATRLELEPGKIYEIALFHAERHTDASHFNLTLQGFVSGRSRCVPRCGDAVVVGRETCDDGKNDGSYGSCTDQCKRAAFCGDGTRDDPHEQCDDGLNITTYGANGVPGCAPGCVLSAYCGDGEVDSAAGEQCDDGDNAGSYGTCDKGCVLGPRCGDGTVQADEGETCDDGNQISGDGCSKVCVSESPA